MRYLRCVSGADEQRKKFAPRRTWLASFIIRRWGVTATINFG